MRIGLAQINTTAGDLAGNRAKILDAYRALVAQGAQLVAFPELAVTGCPPRDLLFKRSFVPDNEDSITQIAAHTGPVPALAGFVETNPSREGRRFFNAAAFCHDGEIRAIVRKTLRPARDMPDMFDEDRYFEPAGAGAPSVIAHNRLRIGVTIGETPSEKNAAPLAAQNPDLVINLSASPWRHGKDRAREQRITAAARALRRPLASVNAIGGNDEFIFGGQSLVAGANGRVLARGAAFAEDLRIVDTASLPEQIDRAEQSEQPEHPDQSEQPDHPAPPNPPDDPALIHAALVLGLRDYARKTGFKRALVALSGGIDSALVAVLAVDALGPENVTGVSLPSAISSQHSRDDARALARNLGIRFETMSIAACAAACEHALAPLFDGRPRDTAEENIQARVRGVLMMALSNKFGALLLATGNKSELATGYCTLYGDMCGGLAVISDLLKTQVCALSRWINRDREIIPRNTIDKPPSAELRPNQTDQDSLPPYDILDQLLRGYLDEGWSRRELIARGFDAATVNDIARRVDLNEYKRHQAPPGLGITASAFGAGRRVPIAQKYAS